LSWLRHPCPIKAVMKACALVLSVAFGLERCDRGYVHVNVSSPITRADKPVQCEAAAEMRVVQPECRCGTRRAHVQIDIGAADIAVDVERELLVHGCVPFLAYKQ
jgi:hypothetical protein